MSMTSLEEKAEEAEVQFVAASDLHPGSVWRIETADLQPADEIGSDEFPQHGEWLQANKDGSVTYFIECPAGLALAIMDDLPHNATADGYWFAIRDVGRSDDRDNAPWEFDVEVATADVETRDDAIEWRRETAPDE